MRFLFHITSSRGTKDIEILNVPKATAKNKESMKYLFEHWCEKHHCWDSSENSMSYGYKEFTPRLQSMYKRYLKNVKANHEAHDEMLKITDYEKRGKIMKALAKWHQRIVGYDCSGVNPTIIQEAIDNCMKY